MTFSRRTFLALTGAAALTPAVAACGGDTRQAFEGIDYWLAFPDDDQRDYFQAERVDAFQGSAPVRVTIKPSESIGRLVQTALAAGAGPDLITTAGPGQVAAFANAGYLLPLDDHARRYGWNDALAPWALAASRVDGKLLSLPAGYESMILIYNPATLAANGWTVPTNGAEFEAICTEAHAKGMIPVSAGNGDYRPASEWAVTVALNHHAGPEAVHQVLAGEIPWTEPVIVDAISRLSDYFQRGWWGGSVEDYFTTGFPAMYAALASGEALFMITGSWALAEIGPYFGEEAGNDATWDWAPLFPWRDGVPAQVWDLGIGQTISINSKSARPDAAAEYLDFLVTDPARQAEGIAEVGMQPTPVRLTAADFPDSVDERQSRLYVELSNAATIGYTTWTFCPQQTDTELYTNFDKVFTGQLEPHEYCTGLDEIFRKELALGKVPAAPAPDGLLR
ncbi:ABC transporter substrate-binding protein [Pseudonocardia sichuanensis]